MSALKDQIQALIDAERANGVPDISGLNITGCKADHVDARGADLSYLKAGWLVVGGAPQFTDMSHLDANKAKLTDSTITGDLSGSNMSGAKLDGTILTNVSIQSPLDASGLTLKL